MKVIGIAARKYVLPAVIVLLLLAVSGSFMTIRFDRFTGSPESCSFDRAYNADAVIYDSLSPARVPGLFRGAGSTSSSTVVTGSAELFPLL